MIIKVFFVQFTLLVTDKNKTHSPGLPRKMNIQHKFQVPSSKFYYISHKI